MFCTSKANAHETQRLTMAMQRIRVSGAIISNDDVSAAGLLNRALDPANAAARDPSLLARRARPSSRYDHGRSAGDRCCLR